MDEYLGDGLYVSFDGFQFRLYTSNGIQMISEVFLEPEVLKNFEDYVQRIRESMK
jgi:hypothetical protein